MRVLFVFCVFHWLPDPVASANLKTFNFHPTVETVLAVAESYAYIKTHRRRLQPAGAFLFSQRSHQRVVGGPQTYAVYAVETTEDVLKSNMIDAGSPASINLHQRKCTVRMSWQICDPAFEIPWDFIDIVCLTQLAPVP